LMELLNLYLTVGAEAIHNQTGVIDKFMGNEIMGLFNTQLNPSDTHAWWAVQAALKMAEEYTALSEKLGDSPEPYCRIGIHTGVAAMGNVGSPTRREFTAIGDTVNLAKRLQENAAPNQIILSEETYRECAEQINDPANHILALERATIQVKGIRQAVKIYEIQRQHR
jgi:adenylate cyclase